MTRSTTSDKEDAQLHQNPNAGPGEPKASPGFPMGPIGQKLLVFLFWILVWAVAGMAVGQELLIPGPGIVFSRLLALLGTKPFYFSIFASMGRIMLGFLLAVVAGTLLSVLTATIPFFKHLFSPLIGMIKATPVASFIILALVWLSSEGVVTFVAFLMVLPLVWGNLSQGIRATDRQLLEMSRMFRFSRWKVVRYVYIPSVMPHFVSAVTTGIGFAWKSGIAAEVLGTPKGSVGQALYNAKIYLETPDLFAWTLVVIILSLIIERGVLWFIHWTAARL